MKFKDILKYLTSFKFVDKIVNLVLIIKINKFNIFHKGEKILMVDDADDRMKFLIPEAKVFNYKIIWHPRTVTDILFNKYIAIKKTKGFGEWNLNTYYEPEIKEKRDLLVSRYVSLLKILINLFKIRIIVLPKLNDDWIIDFQIAAKKLNLKVLVSDRESSISPQRMQVYPPILKKFKDDLNLADIICVNNEMHQEFFLKSGIEENKIRLTGSPQSDFWDQNKNNLNIIKNKKKKNILYLGFGVNAYLNFYFENINDNWNSLCTDIHDVLIEILKNNHKELDIYYKIGSKPARDYWDGYDSFVNKLKKNGCDESLIEVKGSISTPSIIESFDAVISFQSSGIVEAMFCDIPIISLGWGNLYEKIKDSLHNFEEIGIHYANSKNDLKKYIEDIVNEENLSMNKSEFENLRYKYFYKCDGKSSSRIMSEINKLLR
tara:strand:+ start:17464 stop:18762 length:1299 start_codon:yes stop_codon:yes gene_type:complete